ncbi:hypothetical protein [Flavobacterium sp.]
MKKLGFSIIAVVAFSFAGMANETNEKTVETNKEKKEIVGCDHCYDHADSLDDGSDRSNQKWMKNVDGCRTSNGCEAEFDTLTK